MMNKEEIKENIKAYYVKENIDDVLKYIETLQKENKILRENAENNDKVVDKVNWENSLLKQRINKAIDVIEQMIHKGWGKDGYLYYATGESSEFACRGRRIQQILGGKE